MTYLKHIVSCYQFKYFQLSVYLIIEPHCYSSPTWQMWQLTMLSWKVLFNTASYKVFFLLTFWIFRPTTKRQHSRIGRDINFLLRDQRFKLWMNLESEFINTSWSRIMQNPTVWMLMDLNINHNWRIENKLRRQ